MMGVPPPVDPTFGETTVIDGAAAGAVTGVETGVVDPDDIDGLPELHAHSKDARMTAATGMVCLRWVTAIAISPLDREGGKATLKGARGRNFGDRLGFIIREQPENPTALLLAWNRGEPHALDALLPMVYEELHRLAAYYMKGERAGHSLQATALVNEAYLRLIEVERVQWQSRAHFFAMAARLMRRILVDAARSRGYQKRGGGATMVSLDEALVVSNEPGQDLVALDEALTALAAVDKRKSQVVEMRFFGGLSLEETAEALHVSRDTVKRDWKMAKLWLLRELTGEARTDD
jgi:RNA polymerase sigma-70 factor, ECF subfamily